MSSGLRKKSIWEPPGGGEAALKISSYQGRSGAMPAHARASERV